MLCQKSSLSLVSNALGAVAGHQEGKQDIQEVTPGDYGCGQSWLPEWVCTGRSWVWPVADSTAAFFVS